MTLGGEVARRPRWRLAHRPPEIEALEDAGRRGRPEAEVAPPGTPEREGLDLYLDNHRDCKSTAGVSGDKGLMSRARPGASSPDGTVSAESIARP